MNEEQYLKLENQLCFAVYACSKEITKLYREHLEEMNLTFPQYLVMLVLWEKDERTVSDIGEKLYLDSGTLTPMLKRMEQIGLIQRVRLKEDERKVAISLTEQGKALKKQAACIPKSVAPRFGITKEEYLDLLMKLNQLTAQLRKGE
ncbi:MarR family winged helix-turn-helix transcriptional regulator [Priestia abyssalis]|uniref:MarR family winged helix-turn-helix transcriptional regulator n=1 Tax=Priestia abyssalis TaxID=1221450 RepID=UPI00099525E4|nr:MarR family transcriptional regulator [Priestia abyssalis]